MSFVRTIGLLLVGLMISTNAHARLLLIASQESELYQEFISGFSERLGAGSDDIDIKYSEDLNGLDGYETIIVAGVDAAKNLSKRDVGKAAVIYTMMPLSSYQWLVENDQLSAPDSHKVLYIDQPPHRYISLAKETFPHLKSLGYLYGDISILYVDELRRVLEERSMELVAGHVSPKMKLPRDLKGTFMQSDALLLMPDPYLYNRRSVQGVLLASFRYKRPLISYSESFVKAGALMGLFSKPRDIGLDTAELVLCLRAKCPKMVGKHFYPTYFSIVVNNAVARQLGIKVKSSEELRKHLETIENIVH
ncbi:ABC transporter substrate-binding protein [Pseudomonadota bacterium]